MANAISDLLEISKMNGADIEQLLKDSYFRGLKNGIEHAKEKAIEAIKNEK